MPDGREPISVKLIERVADVPAEDWDACAGGGNPFVSHAFLDALESSGSATGEAGWLPRHLVIEDEAGRLLAAAPMYVKGHSYGEYVFDHGWAHAYEQAGGRYYPKLQVSVPFSPVTGPRLLARPGPQRDTMRQALAAGMVEAVNKLGVSSVHVTFPLEEETAIFEDAGFLLRAGMQFHWENAGYRSFDDFLAALVSRKRKAIRKERREVAQAGIRVRPLTGDDITSRHWDAFHRFYVDTYDRKWGYPYLNREFFEMLGATMGDRVALVMADLDGELVAGALNLIGDDALYGRNWGCAGDYRFLHFEACYYQAIDFAIEHGLQRVEAGTQGPHKIQRGYMPKRTWSAHWIRDPGLSDAVADFLVRERRGVDYEIEAFAQESPYRAEE